MPPSYSAYNTGNQNDEENKGENQSNALRLWKGGSQNQKKKTKQRYPK